MSPVAPGSAGHHHERREGDPDVVLEAVAYTRISKATKGRLRACAGRKRMPEAEVVRLALEEYLAREGW